MVGPLPLIVHERIAFWSRHVRSCFAQGPVRVFETRSRADIEAKVRLSSCPVILVDLGQRPVAMLEDLSHAARLAPNALALVLDPLAHPLMKAEARARGAAMVYSGRVLPPVVLALLTRWVRLARRRGDADGWAADPRENGRASATGPWAELADLLDALPT